MKTNFKRIVNLGLVLILSPLFSSSFAAASTDLVYDCGRRFGMEVSIRIQSAKDGAEFPYKATYEGPRVDKTTGMIGFEKIDLVGDTDLAEGPEGKEVAFFYLIEVENDLNHLILQKVVKKGEKVEAVQLLGVNPFKPEGADTVITHQCEVVQGE